MQWAVAILSRMLNSDDPKIRDKAMKNTLKQKKLILSELK